MSILIRYGVGNQITKSVSEFPTLRSIISNVGLGQTLGFSSANTEGVVNGATGIDALSDGDTVDLRSRANEKG